MGVLTTPIVNPPKGQGQYTTTLPGVDYGNGSPGSGPTGATGVLGLLGSAFTGGGSSGLATSALAAAGQVGAAYLTNRGLAAASQTDRDFQERMSSTAYQRAAIDLRKAGLNPILAYTQAQASTPGGSTAKQTDVSGGAIETALGVQRLTQEIKNFKANRTLLQENSAKSITAQAVDRATERRLQQDTATSAQQAKLLRAETIIKEHQIPGYEIDSRINRSWEGEVYRRLEKLGPIFGSALGGFIGGKSGRANMKNRFNKRAARKWRKN